MGLVVQAPLDSLLPVLDAQSAVAATAVNGSAVPAAGEGLFASLLAQLSASLDSPNAATTELSETLVDSADIAPDSEQKDNTSNPFAALLATALPLQLAPTALVAEAPAPPARNGDAAAVVGTVGSSLSSVQLPTEANPAASPDVAPAQSVPLEAAVQSLTPGNVPAESVATAVEATPAAVVADAVAAPPASAAPALAQAAARPRSAESPEIRPRSEAAPPGETAAVTEATSVVRSVGNAETENEMGAGSQPQTREEDKAEAPQPRASAQGIAHAAPNSAVGQLRQAQETAPVEAAVPQEAPAAPAETVPQVEQIATTVIEQIEAGGGEARIHLDPVDLGEVTIIVRTDGDSVRVDVRAERQEAMNLLRDHTQDLSSLLGERGLNLSDVNVGLGRGNGDQDWGQDSRPENRPSNGEFASILGIDEAPASIERHQRLRAAYNPDGAHVYRV